MEFTDSLNGYIVAGNYVLMTTNSGSEWTITDSLFANLSEIEFLDRNTGFICGGNLYKTTNSGEDWKFVNLPMFGISENDMDVISEDTIWLTNRGALDGGIFLTTNGGASWTRKYYAGGFENPEKIYFANSTLGFAERATNNYLRTSNGGETWQIINGPFIWFNDIKFIDSLTGYKANGYIMKTTDGGLTWKQQTLPQDSNFFVPDAVRFSWINDTLWAVGANVFVESSKQVVNSFETRGIVFLTTNDGANWGYQIPDKGFGISRYRFVDFESGKKGWAYNSLANDDNSAGVYTSTGGNDTTIYVGIINYTQSTAQSFRLITNFPNPFNPTTTIKFELKSNSQTDISVYDVSGRLTAVIVSEELRAGVYETVFDGSALSSGIYFCVMQSGSYRESITMALLK